MVFDSFMFLARSMQDTKREFHTAYSKIKVVIVESGLRRESAN